MPHNDLVVCGLGNLPINACLHNLMSLSALPGLPQPSEPRFKHMLYLCPSSPLLIFIVLLAVFGRDGGLSSVPKSSTGSSTAPI